MISFRIVTLVGTLISFACGVPALAQSCKERFVQAATEGNGDGNYRQIVTQRIKGGQGDTINEFIMKGPHHWVTKPIKPAGTGWTLMYDGVMYSSLDEGGSWRQISKFDQKAADAARAQQRSDVNGATDIECATEEIDGKMLDRIHGQYEVTVGFKSTQVHTYWMEQDTGLIIYSEYETISPSFNSTVSQKMIPFANAVVPVP